jgi:hypothetical protein
MRDSVCKKSAKGESTTRKNVKILGLDSLGTSTPRLRGTLKMSGWGLARVGGARERPTQGETRLASPFGLC